MSRDYPAGQHTVLLVEDEVGTQDALATLLRLDGWEVVGAYDGREALDVLLRQPPDVIVTDYMMPNMDGLEMIEEIRANEAWARIPIVMMTASRLEREQLRGVEAFLPKPIDLSELRKVMSTLAQRRG